MVNGMGGMGVKKRQVKQIIWWVVFLFFLAASVLLQAAARCADGFADWYAEQIYPVLVETVGQFFGLFPFSVGEVLLYIGIIVLVVVTIENLGKILVTRKNKRRHLYFCIQVWIMTAVILFFVYTIQCGINYFHTPFSVRAGYEVRPSEYTELEALCRYLTEEINTAAEELEQPENEHYKMPENVHDLVRDAMGNLGEEYEFLSGFYPAPKPIAISGLFSYQYITGIYSPFTIEANYNQEMPELEQPAIMCHELSHLKGFMREDEANFIAYLACHRSGVPELQYSGAMFAYTYCMNALYNDGGVELYSEIYGQLCKRALADRQYMNQWWKQYDTPMREVSDQVNNTYLQANAQADGTKSYGRMVDLMLAEFRSMKAE